MLKWPKRHGKNTHNNCTKRSKWTRLLWWCDYPSRGRHSGEQSQVGPRKQCCFIYLFIFPFISISWKLITLQYGSGFCHTLTLISRGFTCVSPSWSPSHIPLHPMPYDPEIPLLGIHTEETRSERDTCTPMFIAALFIIARTWKQPRCPSADEWIRKQCC